MVLQHDTANPAESAKPWLSAGIRQTDAQGNRMNGNSAPSGKPFLLLAKAGAQAWIK
jgi:hypothetical protein